MPKKPSAFVKDAIHIADGGGGAAKEWQYLLPQQIEPGDIVAGHGLFTGFGEQVKDPAAIWLSFQNPEKSHYAYVNSPLYAFSKVRDGNSE